MNKWIKLGLWGFAITNGVMITWLFWSMRLGEVCVYEWNRAILTIEFTAALLSTIFTACMGYKDLKKEIKKLR